MIDYKKHRERLAMCGEQIYGILYERFVHNFAKDAEQLLSKAEKWDRISNGLKLGELEETMDKAEEMEKWKRRAEKLVIISTDADERVKKYWLALEKLSYKCRDGWTGDDCAEYAAEAIKGYDPT